MPTYTVQVAQGRLDADARSALAAAITQTHAQVTGAPTWFAQVVVDEVRPGHRFLGGRPLQDDLVFVSGTIRGGSRGPDLKRRLATELAATVARVVEMAPRGVWVYLIDLPPEQMVEFGRVLPDAGQEPAWLAEFATADREYLRALGEPGAGPSDGSS